MPCLSGVRDRRAGGQDQLADRLFSRHLSTYRYFPEWRSCRQRPDSPRGGGDVLRRISKQWTTWQCISPATTAQTTAAGTRCDLRLGRNRRRSSGPALWVSTSDSYRGRILARGVKPAEVQALTGSATGVPHARARCRTVANAMANRHGHLVAVATTRLLPPQWDRHTSLFTTFTGDDSVCSSSPGFRAR